MNYELVDLFLLAAACTCFVGLSIHFAYSIGRDALRDCLQGDYAGAVMNLVLSIGNLAMGAAIGSLLYREVSKWMA